MNGARGEGHRLRFGNHSIRLPRSRFLRVLLGVGLLIGGMLWFLPILGLWMLPLGIMVLSIDFHPLRRARRRFEAWRGRRRRKRAGAAPIDHRQEKRAG